jgi:uncharacterized membrane protein YfhO
MSKKKKNPVSSEIKQQPKEALTSSKEVQPKNNNEQKNGNDFFSKRLKGKELWFLLTAIIIGCAIIFQDFITLEKVYLFKDIGSDSINIYFPWLTNMSDYIKANGVPSWTFSQGLGQNMFPLWLGDFFSDILVFLSKDKIPYALAFIEIIKIVLCGLVFYLYLMQLKISEYAACIGAFLFAFSGYVILGGCWTVFSCEALYIALILFGFECWLNSGKIFWFVLGITCMSLLQPFFLFPYAIFLAVYIPVRYNDVYAANWKKFPLFILKTVGFAIVGVAISAYQLLPDLLQYIESPRVGGEAQLITKLKAQPIFGLADDFLRFTTTFRAFGSDMLGTGMAFQGWQNYLEAPLFYCGIFCLVTFPQVFSGLNKKQKIAYGILAGVFVLPIFFPFFRYAFWAFTGDYFRTFSLVITLLLLIFSAKALDHIIKASKVNLIVLGVTVAFLLFLLYSPSDQFSPAINNGLRSFAALLVLVYAALLFGISRAGELRNISRIVLVVACFVELIYCSSQTIGERDVITGADLKEKIGYNDYTVDAVNYIKSVDKGFYRINKDYSSGTAVHQSINDAKVQGYFGTQSYFSFNQKNYIKFLAGMGIINPKDENATRWAMGLVSRPLLFSMASGKYWLCKRPESHLENTGYDSIGKFGNVKVYKNKYFLPLGFVYHQVLDDVSFEALSPFQKDLYLLRGCVVSNDDADLFSIANKFNLADTTKPFSFDIYGQYVSDLRKDTMTITQFKESHIKGTINSSAPGILFFSIPLDEGWKATVNGTQAKIYNVNCGLMGLKMPAGKSDIDLRFEPRLMKTGGMVSCLAILVFIGLFVMDKRKRRKSLPLS